MIAQDETIPQAEEGENYFISMTDMMVDEPRRAGSD